MNRNLNTLLAIAIIGMGLFILPSTLSMFGGQHSWYEPQEIDCSKCHIIEYEEMSSGAYGVHSPHRTADTTFECTDCHNVSMNMTYYATGQKGDHTSAHAVTTVSCLACHGDLFSNGTTCGTTCHYPLSPGLNVMHELVKKNEWNHSTCIKCHREYDDNVTIMRENVFINDVDDNLSNPLEAHRSFFLGMSGENTTESESGLTGPNEACLGCHTGVGANISWTRPTNITFTADKSSGDWAIGDMNATGNNTNFISSSG
jgi:hypothetical protein